MSEQYSKIYRQISQDIESRAQSLLQRPLTSRERSGIWNATSLFMLEAIERHILAARTTTALVETLGQLAAQGDQLRQDTLDSLVDQAASLLRRALSDEEQRRIQLITTAYDAICIAEQLAGVEQPQREVAFQRLVAPPTLP
jgi:hypothetical protein